MESVFSRFESYNFEADQRFVDGLKTLNKSEKNREEAELLNLQLFFYNRFVEPIEQHSYKLWRSSSHCVSGQQDPRTPAASDPQTPARLSFAEVMQLVQEGKEVPGLTKPDIKPSNRSPTPSQMKQVPKPWETAPS